MKIGKGVFYILSFTWGILMTVIGLIAAAALLVTGHKANKYGWCWHIEVGSSDNGVNLGLVFITGSCASTHTKNHECGHAVQNCIWGVLFPFVIAIPSLTRFWDRKRRQKRGEVLEPYDSVWYEAQASDWGNKLINSLDGE